MYTEATKANKINGLNGVTYYVIQNERKLGRSYGIMAESDCDKTDFITVNNLFFTAEEAKCYCKFLAENSVFPCTLKEVLENIFVI